MTVILDNNGAGMLSALLAVAIQFTWLASIEKSRMDRSMKRCALRGSSKVYSALTELKHLEGHRCAKFLSLLAENLVHKGLLNEREVMHMLDQVVD